MPTGRTTVELTRSVITLREAILRTRDPGVRASLREVEVTLRSLLGPTITKTAAAATLGISVTALDRWVADGAIPVVERPGVKRHEVETGPLIDLAAATHRARRTNPRGRAVATAVHTLGLRLRGEGRKVIRADVASLPRPNVRESELVAQFHATTPGERVRQAAEAQPDGGADVSHGDTSPPERGLLAILEVLARHRVELIVIGGLAVAHHGFVRATRDIDIVPSPDADNLARLWSALQELGARPLALDDLRPEDLPVELDPDGIAQGGNWDLRTEFGRLDILQYREGALESHDDYRRLREHAARADYGFGEILVVGYTDLIDLKLLAGRDQDLIDVRALREANEDTGPR